MPIEPRVTVIRMPRALASSTSMSMASSSPGGNKLWWSAAVVQPDISSSTSAMRTASLSASGVIRSHTRSIATSQGMRSLPSPAGWARVSVW